MSDYHKKCYVTLEVEWPLIVTIKYLGKDLPTLTVAIICLTFSETSNF